MIIKYVDLFLLQLLYSNASFVCLCGRVLTELVSKMKDMQMDKTELGCLRAIVLFNPGMPLSAIYIHLSAALINKVILNSAINYIKFQIPLSTFFGIPWESTYYNDNWFLS